MIIVEENDPRDPQATARLKQSHALMESLFPPEDNHYLDIEQLRVPEITFFTAREGDMILGTAAVANKGSYGEVKSMFVSEAARGKGVGAALMRMIEDTAIDAKLPILKLETGNVLHAAHRLYHRHGFTDCGPFADYEVNNTSIFMEKTL